MNYDDILAFSGTPTVVPSDVGVLHDYLEPVGLHQSHKAPKTKAVAHG